MRLKFLKDENGNIAVKFTHEDNGEIKEADFSYVRLINILHSNKYTFDEPEFHGEISEHEQMKIKEMVLAMNEAVITKS